MGPVRVRAHTPPTLSSLTSVCLSTPVFRLRVRRPLFPRVAVFRSMPHPPHCLRSTRLLWITHLPFSYSVSFTTTYVSRSHLFLIVSPLRHLLPPICFALLFCNSFSCVQPLPLLPFLSFIPPSLPPPELLPLSLYHDCSSHPGLVLSEYITQQPSCPPLLLLSEKRRGVIMFVSHTAVIPPQRHHRTIMSYCK